MKMEMMEVKIATCKVCGHKLNKGSLGWHVRNYHHISMSEYRKKYNVPTNRLKPTYITLTCPICQKTFKVTKSKYNTYKSQGAIIYCSKQCGIIGRGLSVSQTKKAKAHITAKQTKLSWKDPTTRAKRIAGLIKASKQRKTGKIVKCKTCGKEFYLPKCRLNAKHYYCSRECRKTGIIVKCVICGKELYKRPNQLNQNKSGIFICKQCKNNSVIIKCEVCGKEIKRTKSKIEKANHHYCSVECRKIGLTKSKLVTCKVCGKQFYRQPWHLKLHSDHFCSRECFDKYWQDGSEVVKCKTCGKQFAIPKNQVLAYKDHYCSKECRKTGEIQVCATCGKKIYRTKKRILTNSLNLFFCSVKCMMSNTDFIRKRMLAAHRKPTRPEQFLINYFKKHNLPYKYTGDGTFSIGRMVPDFVNINGKKHAIDLFGDYWHSKEFAERTGLKYESVTARKRKFKKCGWTLTVIWEHELYDNSFIKKLIK